MGSADLMPRNLDTRVELLMPVESPPLLAEVEDTLERCLADDTFAWDLGAGRRVDPPRGRHALGAPGADGPRALERAGDDAPTSSPGGARRPSRRLSASTRSAASVTRARKRGSRRARASSRGWTWLNEPEPGHQDQVVAGLDRALGGHAHARAVQHRLGLDASR